jgi:hypothetical protein
MNGFDLLKRDALIRRNAAILKAKREYHKELKAIKTLGRSLGVPISALIGPMKHRKLRIAWSVVWGIACVLLMPPFPEL